MICQAVFIPPASALILHVSMPQATRQIVVSNRLGLHARPAMEFVDLANQFSSQVRVFREGDEPAEADGKSVMELITLAATEGTPLRIAADGDDAEKAVAQLVQLFENKFGEE
ncbi:MAG TPA: HPr family phosphocarrier protein [Tepidisphaeraceae bacterium]|nr:HPr family phosphocarrier protein [Tepidisphaeraceae bacterium]